MERWLAKGAQGPPTVYNQELTCSTEVWLYVYAHMCVCVSMPVQINVNNLKMREIEKKPS